MGNNLLTVFLFLGVIALVFVFGLGQSYFSGDYTDPDGSVPFRGYTVKAGSCVVGYDPYLDRPLEFGWFQNTDCSDVRAYEVYIDGDLVESSTIGDGILDCSQGYHRRQLYTFQDCNPVLVTFSCTSSYGVKSDSVSIEIEDPACSVGSDLSSADVGVVNPNDFSSFFEPFKFKSGINMSGFLSGLLSGLSDFFNNLFGGA